MFDQMYGRFGVIITLHHGSRSSHIFKVWKLVYACSNEKKIYIILKAALMFNHPGTTATKFISM